jgi:hypothetical protein
LSREQNYQVHVLPEFSSFNSVLSDYQALSKKKFKQLYETPHGLGVGILPRMSQDAQNAGLP